MNADIARELQTLKRLEERGYGAGLYGRLEDFEMVALARVVVALAKRAQELDEK